MFGQHAHPIQIGDVEQPKTTPLLEEGREFVGDALRGEYYEEFLVNSQNCMNQADKTQEFEAQLDLLLDRLDNWGASAQVPASRKKSRV